MAKSEGPQLSEDDSKRVAVLVNGFTTLKETNDEDHKEIKDLIKAMNGRVRALERWRSFLAGCSAALAFIIGCNELLSLLVNITGN